MLVFVHPKSKQTNKIDHTAPATIASFVSFTAKLLVVVYNLISTVFLPLFSLKAIPIITLCPHLSQSTLL